MAVSPFVARPLKSGDNGFVYYILAERSNLVKVGWAVNPELRLSGLQTGSPEILTLVHRMPGMGRLEAWLHCRYADLRAHGEWFRLEGVLARDLIEKATFPEPEPVIAKPTVDGEPRLWKHKNGVYYILYGDRLKRRISANTRDADMASKALTEFAASR